MSSVSDTCERIASLRGMRIARATVVEMALVERGQMGCPFSATPQHILSKPQKLKLLWMMAGLLFFFELPERQRFSDLDGIFASNINRKSLD